MTLNTFRGVYEVAHRLIGNIEPVGESNYDKKVLENLKETEELIDYFVDMIIDVHKYVDRPEASMSAVGREAYRYMEELYAWLKKYVGESE